MRAPYRIASPPEPVRTEEADSYEARLHAGRRLFWGQMVLLLAGIGGMSTCVVRASHARPSGAEKARRQESMQKADAERTVETARAELERAQSSFDAAVHAAMERRLAPATPRVPCPISLGEPGRLARGRSMTPLLVVRDDAPEPHYFSPSVDRARPDVETAGALLDGVNPLSAVVYTDALARSPVDQRLTRDVVVVVSRWKAPALTSMTAFEPGEVDGMAYVFDFATRRITCAGEVHTSSSKSLEYTYSDRAGARDVRLEERLREDLELQIARAVAGPDALFVTPH